MTDILNIEDEPIFDDRIKIETHTYSSFANTMFGYSDEIRISIAAGSVHTVRKLSVRRKKTDKVVQTDRVLRDVGK